MATTTYSSPTVSVAAIGGRTDSSGEEVPDYTAEEARLITEILEPGSLRPAEAWQVRAQASPNMSVRVGSGTAKADHYVVEGKVAGQGKYIVRLDASSVTLTVPAADASQVRTDEVYLVVLDNSYDATLRGIPQLGYRRGDLGGAAPGPDPAWEAYALLASISVPPAATSITNNEIADEREPATLVQSLLAVDTSNLVTKDLINAKGDLFVGTGNDAVGRLGVGSNGQVLTADSGQASGVKWATPPTSSAGTGFVATNNSISSTSYGDLSNVGPSVTVTVPQSGSVLVLMDAAVLLTAGTPESATATYVLMSFAASGANTIAADDDRAAVSGIGVTAGNAAWVSTGSKASAHVVLTGLNPGSTTFTAKYRWTGADDPTTHASISDRRLSVIPL